MLQLRIFVLPLAYAYFFSRASFSGGRSDRSIRYNRPSLLFLAMPGCRMGLARMEEVNNLRTNFLYSLAQTSPSLSTKSHPVAAIII